MPAPRLRRRLTAALWCTALLAAACTKGDDDAGTPEGPDDDVEGATTLGDGDNYEATIHRTEGGVPHITADSLADVSFGQGWASGEDRTCDLADQILRVTAGDDDNDNDNDNDNDDDNDNDNDNDNGDGDGDGERDDDPVLVNLARAVQVLEAADVAVDVPLGEVQTAERNGTLVPTHGGNGREGTPNIVEWGTNWATLDPALDALERTPVAPGSTLADVTDGETTTTGYRINFGASFLLALAFDDDGPQAKAFLTYANTADRDDPSYLDATEAFSDKAWREVAFTEEAVAEATTETVTVRG